jgi:hypothetical protein
MHQFKKTFLVILKRPGRTVPYSVLMGLTALPLLQRLAGLSWDQCVIAFLVPMALIYVGLRLCFHYMTTDEQMQMEREHAKFKNEAKPIPADIGFALILLVLLLSLELVLWPSVLVYWLLHVPFIHGALTFTWLVARVAIVVIAYIGASLCWRWCLPLLRYEMYSLIATLFGISGGQNHRRRILSH